MSRDPAGTAGSIECDAWRHIGQELVNNRLLDADQRIRAVVARAPHRVAGGCRTRFRFPAEGQFTRPNGVEDRMDLLEATRDVLRSCPLRVGSEQGRTFQPEQPAANVMGSHVTNLARIPEQPEARSGSPATGWRSGGRP